MTANSPKVKQLVQISEQVFDPVQVPVQIGGDFYIVTQQDVRKIEDTRYLSYQKYVQQQPQSINLCNCPIQNRNQFDENHFWNTLTTALLVLRSTEMNSQKIDSINKLLESLTNSNKGRNPTENQMQWECDMTNQRGKPPICSLCNHEIQSENKRVKFIQDACCCLPPIILKNHGTQTCYFATEEQANIQEEFSQQNRAEETSCLT